MIEKSNVMSLFSIPVLYDLESGYEFDSEEIEFLKNYPTTRGVLNTVADGSLILDDPCMAKIKNFLQGYLDRYTKDILKIKQNFRITHTWFTKNLPGEQHHRHSHYHSIVSGLLYVHATPGMGNFNLYHEPALFKAFPFEYDCSEYNQWNSSQWFFEVKTGTVILFPSWMQHSADVNTTNEQRLAVAFNSFVEWDVNKEISL